MRTIILFSGALLCAMCLCGCTKSKSRPEIAIVIDGKSTTVEPIASTGPIFQPLGVLPLLGRDFLPEEFAKGSPATAIISSEVFAAAFASRPAEVMGRKIRVADQDFFVVGVAPPQHAALKGKKVWLAQQK
jgi:hypothetical protein